MADDLIAKRMTFRLGWKRCAYARSSRVECVESTDALRFRKEYGDAIRKRRHDISEDAAGLIRRRIESVCERGGGASQLLRMPAAQIGLLARDAAAPHARLESLHVSDAGV